MSISVALAAYNGGKYIGEQIKSILPQLGDDDELIISDDNPSGDTKPAVEAFNDKRIKYIAGRGKGVVANFENAINNCTGDYIYLCDQDDVWLPDKVNTVQKLFEDGADIVLHNAIITDANLNNTGKTSFELYNSNTGFTKNFIRNSFVGCCMAIRREVLVSSLPFPASIPMHDWWIGLNSIKKGFKIVLTDEPLIFWRRHGDNVTGATTTLLQKLKFRIKMIGYLFP